jgi:hypothetical protein
MKKLFIIIILIIGILKLNSQDTNNIKYLPLKVGNSWFYYYMVYQTGFNFGSGYEKYTVIGSQTINNKQYYSISRDRIILSGPNFCGSRLWSTDPIRVDSVSSNIYKAQTCGLNNERFIDSLKSMKNDTAFVCGTSQGNLVICTDTSYQNIFGINKQTKTFRIMSFEGFNTQKYAKDIGLVSYNFGQLQHTCYLTLLGCVIDGVVYGDTGFITGINQISSEVPEQFSLSQNYPNPFNPATHFEFRIADFGLVRLIVYNAVGEEIETLVNRDLSPGTYRADFDGSSLPSGVYFYRLEAFDPSTPLRVTFTQTKKMVLIK